MRLTPTQKELLTRFVVRTLVPFYAADRAALAAYVAALVENAGAFEDLTEVRLACGFFLLSVVHTTPTGLLRRGPSRFPQRIHRR